MAKNIRGDNEDFIMKGNWTCVNNNNNNNGIQINLNEKRYA